MIHRRNNIHLFLLVLLGLIGPFSAIAQATVSGTVHTPLEDPICDVTVSLLDENGQTIAQSLTTEMGTFSFADVPLNSSYGLHLEKEENPVNGISAYDQVFMMRSILGIEPLDPDQQLAADVDNSGSVSVLDIVHVRRLILYIIQEFPQPSWLFGVAGLPIGSETISLGQVTEDLNLEIIGLKTGDVNYSAVPCY